MRVSCPGWCHAQMKVSVTETLPRSPAPAAVLPPRSVPLWRSGAAALTTGAHDAFTDPRHTRTLGFSFNTKACKRTELLVGKE